MIELETLKKKIIYRANYRGTKEMDILLSIFVDKYFNRYFVNHNEMLKSKETRLGLYSGGLSKNSNLKNSIFVINFFKL